MQCNDWRLDLSDSPAKAANPRLKERREPARLLGFPLGDGRSQLDLVPDDPQSLREAAERRTDMTLSEAKRAFLIEGDDRVGAVADTTAKLTDANINLTAAAATTAGSGRYGMILWVAPAGFTTARRKRSVRSEIEVLLYLDQDI